MCGHTVESLFAAAFGLFVWQMFALFLFVTFGSYPGSHGFDSSVMRVDRMLTTFTIDEQ
jgi:hypothetical protein